MTDRGLIIKLRNVTLASLTSIPKVKAEEKYNKIPGVFYTFEEWVKKTDRDCYYCSTRITHTPVPILGKSTMLACGSCYDVAQVACSINCVLSYLEYMYQPVNFSSSRNSILYYTSKILKHFDIDIEKIHPAPKRDELIRFGGHLSHEDFSKDFTYIDL
jgi:hypothetical protein